MRPLYIPILLILLLAHAPAGAQKTGVELGAGWATFRMDDMKYLQEHLLDNFPIEGKILASFPSYLSTTLGVTRQWYPNVRIGASYLFSSTGGRANYSDYSGSYTINMQAVSNRLGANITYAFLQGEWYDISLFGQLGVNISSIRIEESIYLLYGSDWSDVKYRAFSPCGAAGVEFMVHLNVISLGVTGGYHVDLPGDLKQTDSGTELTDPGTAGGDALNADFTGLRSGIKLIFWFGS